MKNRILIATLLSTFLLAASNVQAASFTDNQTVDSNKTWTIKFTGNVEFDESTKQGITVTDSKGNPVNTVIQLEPDGRTVTVTAPEGGYTSGESYTLNIGTNAHSNKGKSLKKGYKVNFNIKNNIKDSTVITFKDIRLENAVRDEIRKPAGAIYKSDVMNITSLKAEHRAIKDISGIENLENLQTLILNENVITDLTPLTNLSSLTKLELRSNCKMNNLKPLENLINLTHLDVSNANIKVNDITPLKNMYKLKYLNLSENNITDISVLKDKTSLTYLNLSWNSLNGNIDNLKNLTNMESLYLASSKISDITPLKNMTELKNLDLARNKISDVTILNNFKNLMMLDLSDNLIEDISSIKDLTNMDKLNIETNKITNIEALRNMTKLKFLYLDKNQITDFSPIESFFRNIPNRNFRCDEKPEVIVPDANTDYSQPINGYVYFKDKNLEKAVRNTINNLTKPIEDYSVKHLTYLDAGNLTIKNLDGIENLKGLKFLNLAHNDITDLTPLRSLTNLVSVGLGENPNLIDISVLEKSPNFEYENIDDYKQIVQTNIKAKEIIAQIIKEDMTDLQKERAVHDYIVSNTRYDYENYLKDTVPQESRMAYGILIKGTGVCGGYADAMKNLLDRIGVETMIVGGTADGAGGWESHGWNIVKIDGSYYHVDATFDDPVPDVPGRINYNYFNLKDSEISKDHKWDTSKYPKCE